MFLQLNQKTVHFTRISQKKKKKRKKERLQINRVSKINQTNKQQQQPLSTLAKEYYWQMTFTDFFRRKKLFRGKWSRMALATTVKPAILKMAGLHSF